MSDLTRRVLKADQYMDRSPVTDWNKFDTARLTLEDAAPTLARQVEAVEALADRLDAEAERLGPRGGGFTARAFAAEIRAALTNTEQA